MTKGFTRNLRFNETGNEVSFEIAYQDDLSVVTPGVFRFMESQDVNGGQIIFNYGEPSDYLYYIVKGQYEVIVNNRVVSSLSPDDIFMGEMSFLLNNRRSATVKAQTAGKLIRISKKDFVEAIRRKPQYALFLSRLLAQRIQRLNERTSVPS
jgi:CRP-like cAMP-binding protein